MASSNFSPEELNTFYSIDRDLLSRLVLRLGRNPAQSMRVIAFWLWMEQDACLNIVDTLRSWSDQAVLEVFQEALTLIDVIHSPNPPSPSTSRPIPRTHTLMEGEMTLQSLYDNRVKAIEGLLKIMAGVGATILRELLIQQPSDNAAVVEAVSPPASLPSPWVYFNGIGPVMIRHFAPPHMLMLPPPMATVFRPQNGTAIRPSFEVGESSSTAQRRALSLPDDDQREGNIMFMTFSRGYRVWEQELRNYLFGRYGDVVERIHMQETAAPNIQPLFAIVVFRSSETVDQILNGKERVGFVIQRKHVLAGRYVHYH